MRLLVALGAFLFSAIVLATPLHNIVVFGDSLSDNGNLYEVMKHQIPPSPPYFEGRFSNGPLWIEHLIQSYFPENPSMHLQDYAYGGAGVSEEDGDDEVFFTLRREITTYLLTHHDKASEDSLYVVWIGANNYLALPSEAEKVLQSVHVGILHSLQRLVEKGAKHILVVNLPDLGRSPAALQLDAVAEMNYFTREHNNLLAKAVSHLQQEYPEVQWLYYDLYHAFNEVLEHSQDYGFTNITDTCIDSSAVDDLTKTSVLKMVAAAKPGMKQNDACSGYLFFDLVHPTAIAHKILGERARAMLDGAGVEIAD